MTINIPTLLIWGAKDFALIESMAQASLDLCKNGRLEIFEDATHWVQRQLPPAKAGGLSLPQNEARP